MLLKTSDTKSGLEFYRKILEVSETLDGYVYKTYWDHSTGRQDFDVFKECEEGFYLFLKDAKAFVKYFQDHSFTIIINGITIPPYKKMDIQRA